MRLFTDNPLERLMVEVPRPGDGKTEFELPKCCSCYVCKRYTIRCTLPCYRGVKKKPRL